MNDLYPYILVTVLGIVIGSFLNVLIYRLPRDKKFVFSRSACPKCGKNIKFYDNIPLLSYLILGGKCRSCKEKISIIYPVVEFLNGALYFMLAHYYLLQPEFFVYALLGSALIVIFFIDLEHMIIPDSITIPGMIVGLIFSFTPWGIGILQSSIGLVVGGGSFFLVAMLGEKLFKKESMGGGDIKMAAMLGAFLGWQKIILVFFGSAVIGMVISIVILSVSSKMRESRMIPFGPFIAVTALISILFGDAIIAFYIENFLKA